MKRLRANWQPRSAPLAFISLAAALALAGCGGNTAGNAGAGGGRGGRGGRGGGAQPVVVTRVAQKDVPIEIAAVGNVEAYTTITVRSQVTGTLEDVAVQAGNFVKKNQLLFTLDQRPFQAAVDQAQANLTRDQALLAQSEAQLTRDAANAEYQQLSAERQAELVARGIVSKDAGEQTRAQADATAALVKADKAAIDSAKAQLIAQQAAVDNAKVQLGYCVIRSPIDGRLGDVSVKAGNLVTANNSQITTISQVEPVFVTFAVPAVHLPTIKQHMNVGEPLLVIATPQDVEAEPVEGKLAFLDSAVDQATDTIKLKAAFSNADHRLWPGQFARVTLRLTTLKGATVVPEEAVQTGQDGQFVFVVRQGGGRRGGARGGNGQARQGGGNGQAQPGGNAQAQAGGGRRGGGGGTGLTVEQRPVVVGQRIGDDMVITRGLQPGETVVTEGQLRLEDGTAVEISDANGNVQGGGRGGRGGRGRGGQNAQGGQGAGGQRGLGQGGGQ